MLATMLIFVRHGEVENPRHVVYADLAGFELSDLGRRQASDAADRLASLPVTSVWSSPLVRALRTAEPIAARHGLPVRVDEALSEWRLLSRWRGVVWEELDRTHPGEVDAYLADPTDLPFSDEPLDDLARRVATAAAGHHARDAATATAGMTVVVSHQDSIHAGVRMLTGEGFGDFHRDKPEHAEPLHLTPGNPWRRVDKRR